jgi:hypothetical protein
MRAFGPSIEVSMNDNYSPDYLRQGMTLGMSIGAIKAIRTFNKERRHTANRVIKLLRRMKGL